MYQLVFIIPTYSIGSALISPACDSLLTSVVEPAEQSLALALSTASFNLLQAVSPALGGYILQDYGFETLGILGVIGPASILIAEYFCPIFDKWTISSRTIRRNLASLSIGGWSKNKDPVESEEKVPMIA